jgi:hypothetical protein
LNNHLNKGEILLLLNKNIKKILKTLTRATLSLNKKCKKQNLF